ncbi:MAG: DUF4339 domain-containing protein [Planctomycetota bacterium]
MSEQAGSTPPSKPTLTKKRFLVRFKNGGEAGPMPAAELQSLVSAGTLEREDLVSVDGADRWVSASSVRGLFNEAMGAATDSAVEATVPQEQAQEKPQATPEQTALGCALLSVLVGVLAVGAWFGVTTFFRGPESSARDFMVSWESSTAEAVQTLDGRAISPVKRLIREFPIQSFDGDLYRIGENSITNRATGVTIETVDFRVNPVVKFGSSFSPQRFKVSVAKDSGKVILIEPW